MIKFILCLFIAASTALGQVTFGRDGDHLTAYTQYSKEITVYHVNTVTITLEFDEISIYSTLPNIPDISSAAIHQYYDGTFDITIWQHSGMADHSYASFQDAITGEQGYILVEMFCELNQSLVLRSTHWFNLLDGTDSFPDDGERDVACRYYLEQTDDADYRARTVATNWLSYMGDDAAYWLLIADDSGFSPETQMRVDSILATYPY